MYECFAYIYVLYHMYTWCPSEARRACWIPWDWSYHYELRLEPSSSRITASALTRPPIIAGFWLYGDKYHGILIHLANDLGQQALERGLVCYVTTDKLRGGISRSLALVLAWVVAEQAVWWWCSFPLGRTTVVASNLSWISECSLYINKSFWASPRLSWILTQVSKHLIPIV